MIYLMFDGWLMDLVIVEAKYIYIIYIYIYMYHGYPGMSKQVFHQLLELDAFASQTSARFIEKRGITKSWCEVFGKE